MSVFNFSGTADFGAQRSKVTVRSFHTWSSGILLVVVVASHNSVHHQSQEIIQRFPSAGTWYREPCRELGELLLQEPGARFSSRVVLFYPPKRPCSRRVVLCCERIQPVD